MSDPVTQITGVAPVQGGVTTDRFAGDQYKWVIFTITADPGPLNVVLDGAVGLGGLKDYIPKDSDYAPLQTMTTIGTFKQYVLPTQMRFRVVTGTNVVIRVQQRTDPVPDSSSSYTGGAPTSLVVVPFVPGNTVGVGNFTNYNNALYPVTVAHTFGATFDPTKHGTPVAVPGANGTSIVNRGAWAPATNYAQGDLVSFAGATGVTAGLYSSNAAHTSGAVFTPANWTLAVAKGADAPDPTIITGLTGGTTGCITYLSGPGTVRDLDRSMLGKLRDNIPLFFKHPDGTYRQLNQGTIKGLAGLTAPYAMTLKQKATNADSNVAYYDTSGTDYQNKYQPTAFQGYLEPARVLDAATLLANMNLASVRFGDTSANPIQTVQDKVITTGTYAYTNNAAIPAGIWTFPWGAPGSTYRFGSSDVTLAPSGGIAEFNNSGNTLFTAMHAGVTAFIDGGSQAVFAKGDGAAQPIWLLQRISGTNAAPVAVGLQGDVANKRWGVGYFNGAGWVDTTDPVSGFQATPSLGGSVGFRAVLDVIGNFIGAKVWPTGTAEPTDYTVWGWQSTVTAAGGAGVADNYGRLWVGDYGVYWAAPGAAPRGP